MLHDLIKTGDRDAFPQICDRNGEVALAYCRRCHRAEGELDAVCEEVDRRALLELWPQWPRMQLTLTIPIAGSVARGEYRRDGFVYLVDECRGEISWR
jgi:hypothetical protein